MSQAPHSDTTLTIPTLIQDWLLIARRSLTLSKLTTLLNVHISLSPSSSPLLAEAKVRPLVEPHAHIDPTDQSLSPFPSSMPSFQNPRLEAASLLAAHTCLVILLSDSDAQQGMGEAPTYAALNWGRYAGDHARMQAARENGPGARKAEGSDAPLQVDLLVFLASEAALTRTLRTMRTRNATQAHDLTPLHLCAMYDLSVTMELLLHRPTTDVNVCDRMGRTPLVYALQTGDDRCLRLLLSHAGIDVGVPSAAGGGCDVRTLLKNALRTRGRAVPAEIGKGPLTPEAVRAAFGFGE